MVQVKDLTELTLADLWQKVKEEEAWWQDVAPTPYGWSTPSWRTPDGYQYLLLDGITLKLRTGVGSSISNRERAPGEAPSLLVLEESPS